MKHHKNVILPKEDHGYEPEAREDRDHRYDHKYDHEDRENHDPDHNIHNDHNIHDLEQIRDQSELNLMKSLGHYFENESIFKSLIQALLACSVFLSFITAMVLIVKCNKCSKV